MANVSDYNTSTPQWYRGQAPAWFAKDVALNPTGNPLYGLALLGSQGQGSNNGYYQPGVNPQQASQNLSALLAQVGPEGGGYGNASAGNNGTMTGTQNMSSLFQGMAGAIAKNYAPQANTPAQEPTIFGPGQPLQQGLNDYISNISSTMASNANNAGTAGTGKAVGGLGGTPVTLPDLSQMYSSKTLYPTGPASVIPAGKGK